MNNKLSSCGRSVFPLGRAAVWIASFAAILALGAETAHAAQRGDTPATSTSLVDTDADGLVNRIERLLGSSTHELDSDGDAYSDLEEFARHMSPLQPWVTRPYERLRLGMTAYGHEQQIHVVVAMYVPDGNFRRVRLQLGMAANGRIIEVSNAQIAANSDFRLLPALKRHARIVLMDVAFRNVVTSLRDVTFFAVAGRVGAGATSTADTLQLLMVDGVVVVAMEDLGSAPTPVAGRNVSMLTSSAGRSLSRTIFVPLLFDDEGDAPDNWTPGQVCFQTSSTIGGSGASVTQEVVSAECREGWDGSCPPSCIATVGATSNTLDPLVLIGG